MTKELFLLRGLPGSGKSTLAKSLGGKYAEADQYFMEDGEYKFDSSKIKDAHGWCQNIVDSYLRNAVEKVIVANTFTQEWEMKPYYDLAKEHGYMVFSLIVENRHGGKNVHNVPDDAIDKMGKRFEVIL